ncbi:MAG TPA: Clp protease N-terminal domain-containing protein, partial [Gemmatimonadaceae bacterium]|jgi:ATP-dependent Clp protease ATP-binding subunit ClpA|nr:Clp protease N-terminal domain-containing protein [Gemmatimonadaceae bacterium]
MNGYNFTDRVRRVLARAREEAGRLRHEYVGTEHILLGLTGESEGITATVLHNMGADRLAMRDKIEEIVRPGTEDRNPGPDLPYTSRAKKVLELAMGEARILHHSYVGTEHLLLGLLAEQKGIAAQVMVESGVTLEKARAETLRLLGTPPVRPATPESLTAIPHAAAPGYARSRGHYGVALVDDFTGRAREALRAAYAEAAARDAAVVELSHVLLGLAVREDGMAAVLFDQVAGSRQRVAAALVERLPESGQTPTNKTLPLAEDTQRALDQALLEASKDGHRRAGTQHLLLAVLDALPLSLAAACAQLGLTAKGTRTVYERMKE